MALLIDDRTRYIQPVLPAVTDPSPQSPDFDRALRLATERARDAALARREAAGGPGELEEGERVGFVEPGDTLTEIAGEFDVPLETLIDANVGNIRDPDLIYPEDVVFLPPPDPVLAAGGPRLPNGAPEGEAAFSQSLNERGNALEHADAFEDLGYGIPDLQSEVETYLQTLPAVERQAAAQRLLDETWETAGPARIAIEDAAVEVSGPRLPNGVPERVSPNRRFLAG
jgi:LysM repeat protein